MVDITVTEPIDRLTGKPRQGFREHHNSPEKAGVRVERAGEQRLPLDVVASQLPRELEGVAHRVRSQLHLLFGVIPSSFAARQTGQSDR